MVGWLTLLALAHTAGATFLVYIGATERNATREGVYWLLLIVTALTAATLFKVISRGVGSSSRLDRLFSLWVEAKERELKQRASGKSSAETP
jgi:hypothetical protein